MLYLLDYAKPLKGCNYQLPCTVDSKTYEANSVMARSELNLTSKNERMSLSVATGRLMLVAQCVPSSGYTNGVMVRMGKSSLAFLYQHFFFFFFFAEDSDPGTSSITCIPPAPMQSRTSSFQGPAPSPTSARPLQSITTSELGSSEITSPPFYTIPPQLNLPT